MNIAPLIGMAWVLSGWFFALRYMYPEIERAHKGGETSWAALGLFIAFTCGAVGGPLIGLLSRETK